MNEKRMNLCFTISNVALPASKNELASYNVLSKTEKPSILFIIPGYSKD